MALYRIAPFMGSFPVSYADKNNDDDNSVMYIASSGIYRNVDLGKYNYSFCLSGGRVAETGERWTLIFVPLATKKFIEEYFARHHDVNHVSRELVAKALLLPILFEYERRKEAIHDEVFQKYKPAAYAEPDYCVILDSLVGLYPDSPLPSNTINGFILFDVDVPLLDLSADLD